MITGHWFGFSKNHFRNKIIGILLIEFIQWNQFKESIQVINPRNQSNHSKVFCLISTRHLLVYQTNTISYRSEITKWTVKFDEVTKNAFGVLSSDELKIDFIRHPQSASCKLILEHRATLSNYQIESHTLKQSETIILKPSYWDILRLLRFTLRLFNLKLSIQKWKSVDWIVCGMARRIL